MYLKLSAAVTVMGLAVVALAAPAFATSPTPTSEATGLFNANWQQVTDLVKGMAPIVIGASLILLAIRKVVRSVSKARTPSF